MLLPEEYLPKQQTIAFFSPSQCLVLVTLSKTLTHRSTRSLAPLHGINYLTPSIVALAAKKVYRHRITIASADEDRSLQYGSHRDAVSRLLKRVNSDAIIDEVIEEVEAPL